MKKELGVVGVLVSMNIAIKMFESYRLNRVTKLWHEFTKTHDVHDVMNHINDLSDNTMIINRLKKFQEISNYHIAIIREFCGTDYRICENHLCQLKEFYEKIEFATTDEELCAAIYTEYDRIFY